MIVSGLLTIALLLVPGTHHEGLEQSTTISLTVKNSFSDTNRVYSTLIAHRGVLLGAMLRLQNETSFNFTTRYDPNYGSFLESVNGVAGNDNDHTYWELLGQSENGNITRADVGVGCYIPRPNEHIILNFTTW